MSINWLIFNFIYLTAGSARAVKHHVGTICPNPSGSYELAMHEVPAGETAGHIWGSDWFASDAGCAALLS